jgi:pimeloyl-ACP methyl ester carboxylesterase
VGSLGTSCRVLAPDLRASGRSVYAGALDWELLADDVNALLDHVGLERAVVGGTSMGTAVALSFALRYPARTAGLLLVSPLYAGDEHGLTERQRAAMRAMDDAGRRALAHGIEALLPLYGELPPELRERAVAMARGFEPASVAATTRFLASGKQPFVAASALHAIDVPVLLVPGADPEHPAEVAELYARHLPRVTVVAASAPDLAERLASFCARAR